MSFGCQTNTFSLLISNPGNKAILKESVPIEVSSSYVNTSVTQRKTLETKLSFQFSEIMNFNNINPS